MKDADSMWLSLSMRDDVKFNISHDPCAGLGKFQSSEYKVCNFQAILLLLMHSEDHPSFPESFFITIIQMFEVWNFKKGCFSNLKYNQNWKTITWNHMTSAFSVHLSKNDVF
jgi:hypothetical protein